MCSSESSPVIETTIKMTAESPQARMLGHVEFILAPLILLRIWSSGTSNSAPLHVVIAFTLPEFR